MYQCGKNINSFISYREHITKILLNVIVKKVSFKHNIKVVDKSLRVQSSKFKQY